MIFNQKPALTISDIFSTSALKTAAFGGVEIGSINAQEEAKAAAAINPYGSIPIASPSPTWQQPYLT